MPLATFLGAIAFTMSRGGFLALLVGMVVFAIYRFQGTKTVQVAPGMYIETYKRGGGKAIAFLIVMVPIMLVGFGGRQSTYDSNQGSSSSNRIELWADWLQEVKGHPILGVSPTIAPADAAAPESDASPPGDSGDLALKKLRNVAMNHLAHNSYIQSFADLGFFGGVCFLGAFLCSIGTLHRYAFGKTNIYDLEQKRVHPYLIAAVSSYMTGMLSLSINYLVTTVFVLALPLVYYGMTPCFPPVRPARMDSRGVLLLTVASVGFLGCMYVFVRIFNH